MSSARPSSTEVGVATLAACFGIGARQVRHLVRDGSLPRPTRRGVYDLASSVRAWIEHRLSDRDATIAESKRRFWHHRAEREELESRRLAGTLLDRDDVTQAVTRMAATLAASLDGVAGRIAAKVVAAGGDRAAVRELLFREHRELRAKMARSLEALRGVEPDSDDDGEGATAAAAGGQEARADG